MTKYVIDTQLLIRAFRNPTEAAKLESFLSNSIVYLSSVVASELRAGAQPHQLGQLRQKIIRPSRAAKRVVTPTHRAWVESGRVIQGLRDEGRQITPSLANDVLIGISAAESGVRVLHDNARDFEAIARHYPRLNHMTLPL
ncbi:MAG TPA: type II toxin-antitoxin system VapC family toxin [Longimicrobium sp.]|nr:type II toxin-antitoxin system VapC family toxin [Longimicrobium sp.]